jgi:hypothetical protein
MREIKFRGKRRDNEEWIKGYYREHKGRSQIGRNVSTDGYYFAWFEVIPETVGQYFNDVDINGEDLYEGDVISVLGGESWNGYRELDETCLIVWNNGGFRFRYNNIEYGMMSIGREFSNIIDSVEKVDTIWDNEYYKNRFKEEI